MKRDGRIRLLSALIAVASWACAHASELQAVVAERATYDLQCATDSLEITDLPGMAYGVRGCGQQATYILSGTSCQNPKQLTKREVKIYCTPVLDHSGAVAPVEPVEPVDQAASPESAAEDGPQAETEVTQDDASAPPEGEEDPTEGSFLGGSDPDRS